MATISEILHLVRKGANSVLGTGTKGYRPSLKKVSAMWLLPSGFKLDKTKTLDQAYVQELQRAGNLIIINGIRAFTDNSQEDQTEELEDGTKSITRLGLYEFNMNFINGMYFHAALHSLSGFSNYDVIFIDRDGNILGTESNDSSIKGFSVGMLQADKMTWATDSTAAREGINMQLLDRTELDQEYAFIQRLQLDFNPLRENGVNEVLLTYPSVPANGATTFTVKAVRKQDREPMVGLALADFLIQKDGVTITPSAISETSSGVYEFTVTALATNEVLTAELYDSNDNKNVIVVDVDLYKSNEATATVV